jgi:hypothetical protein
VNGWVSVTVLVQMAVAVFLVRVAARRWWDYLTIAALTALLIRPALLYFTGDISRYLPDAIWSGGSDAKEQIIYASAASTILLPLIASATTVYGLKQAWRRVAKRLV